MKKRFTTQNLLTAFLFVAFGVLIKYYPVKSLQPVPVSPNEEPANAPALHASSSLPEKSSPGATPVDTKINSEKTPAESREEHLKKMGFVQDPDDPDQVMKKTYKDGKLVSTSYRKKNIDTAFQPPERTAKDADELLERKKAENPEDEILNLRRVDFKDDESSMLAGRFRDDEADLEFSLGSIQPESVGGQVEDYLCFAAPKLNLNFKYQGPGYVIRTDDTGYGIARFSDQIYVRMMWSMERERIVHGQVIKFENNQFTIVKNFKAIERANLDSLMKYCK